MRNAGQHLRAWAMCVALCAQAAPALVVQPWRTELTLVPGCVTTGDLVVSNEQAVPVELAVSLRDLTAGANARMGTWIEMSASTQRLEAGQAVSIPYTISVPAEAEGEFVARVGFVQNPAGRSGPISTKISVPIFVIVDGTQRYGGSVDSIRMDSAEPLRVTVTVRNSGNVHLRARGECVVSDADDREVLRFPLNEQGFPLYPGRACDVAGKSDQALTPGTYRAEAVFPFPDAGRLIAGSAEWIVEDVP